MGESSGRRSFPAWTMRLSGMVMVAMGRGQRKTTSDDQGTSGGRGDRQRP
jgi:hypothetical protein